MPRATESEGDFDEDDGPEDYEYHPEADDPGVFWCPKCGAEMYGDASLCAKCGDYVKPGLRPSTPTPWWVWAFIILMGLFLLGGVVAAALQ